AGASVISRDAVGDKEPSADRVRFDSGAAAVLRGDDAAVKSCGHLSVFQFDQAMRSGDYCSPGQREAACAATLELIIARERVEKQKVSALVVLQTHVEDRHGEAARGG